MATREASFVIRAKLTPEASKALKEQAKLVKEQKTEIIDLGKQQNRIARDTERALKSLHSTMAKTGSAIAGDFRKAGGELKQFGAGIEVLADKLGKLRGAIAGAALVGAAGYGIKRLLDEGRQTVRAQERIRREFGNAEGQRYIDRATSLGRRGAIDDDDALQGLTPIAEAVATTQAGSRYRGKRLTEAGAAALRKQTFEFGAGLLERIVTVTGNDATETGQIISEAGSGPEGMKRFVSSLHLNKVFAKRVQDANAKGKLFELLGKEQADSLGVKRGQQAGQGTVLDAILRQSGITEEAAGDKRKTFDFQMQSIGVQALGVVGDIGTRAVKELNKQLGQGVTIAQKLEAAISSPKGQEMIGNVAKNVERAATGFVKLIEAVPTFFGAIERHRTQLELLGGTAAILYGGFKIGQGIKAGREVIDAFRGPKGGALAELAGGGSGKPIPVYVVNGPMGGVGGGAAGGPAGIAEKAGSVMGKVAGALIAAQVGYAIGTAFDEATGLSDKISEDLNEWSGAGDKERAYEKAGVDNHKLMLKRINERRAGRIRELEGTGLSHGMAVNLADNPGHEARFMSRDGNVEKEIAVTLTLDGQVLSKVVAKHMAKGVKAATANGAAPAGGT